MTKQRYSYSKDKINILLLEGVHSAAAELFKEAGYSQVSCMPKAPSAKDLATKLQTTHILGLRSRSQLTAELLQQAPRLLAVGCFCIGTNQVDLPAAELLGIPVFNAPYSNTRSVAELVLAEIILLLRQVPAKSTACHQGQWEKSAEASFETRGKTLGIIGYGHIGSQLGVLAESLGMHVVYHDIENKLPLGNARAVTKAKLLKESDVISLHVPETPQTKLMIGAAELQQMKPQSIFINASRGSVVDIPSLAKSIKSKHLLGAAVDVFPKEPSSNQESFKSPLQGLSNVILTPHIGGSTLEAQANIAVEVASKLLRYSDNGSTLSAVNFPEVALPSHDGRSRLLHIHQNKPGVMNLINEVFSAANINIAGQYLQTSSQIGYVVIDVELKEIEPLLQRLKAIPGTVKTRVLF